MPENQFPALLPLNQATEVTIRRLRRRDPAQNSPAQNGSAQMALAVLLLIFAIGLVTMPFLYHLQWVFMLLWYLVLMAAPKLLSILVRSSNGPLKSWHIKNATDAVERMLNVGEEIKYIAIPPLKLPRRNNALFIVTTQRVFASSRTRPETIRYVCPVSKEELVEHGGILMLSGLPKEKLFIQREYETVAIPANQVPLLAAKPSRARAYASLMQQLDLHRRRPTIAERQLTRLPAHLDQHSTWPTPQDFNEAIQTPTISFASEELKTCAAQVNAMGIPVPVSGAFASVYKLISPQQVSPQQAWAIKCFMREVPDQVQRYGLINNLIKRDNLDCLVGFEFMQNGIRVHDAWYPILKMDWLEGASILDFIDAHCNDSAALAQIAYEFLDVTLKLKSCGIAHGDLQHGNMIITENGLRLVDYDGMFVPGMEGMLSNELGHRNYQHPGREAHHFGSYIDNFSDWVIYLSLHSLAIAPQFWHQTGGGDECLLFKQEDFIDPDSSSLFREFLSHEQEQIRMIGSFLSGLCKMPFPSVPPVAPQIPAVDKGFVLT